MITGRGIYFVGGASASGKSVATRQMAADHNFQRIELDKIYNALEGTCNKQTREQVIKIASASFAEELVASGASMIVEGGWMWPDKAVELVRKSSGRMCAVFCGYPDANAEDRFKTIQAYQGTGPKHWLAKKDQAEAISFLQQQIEGSRKYRDAANQCGLPFFDFTDVSEGNRQLLEHFRKWVS